MRRAPRTGPARWVDISHDLLDYATLRVPCTYCGALAFEACVTDRGLPAQDFHRNRREIGHPIYRGALALLEAQRCPMCNLPLREVHALHRCAETTVGEADPPKLSPPGPPPGQALDPTPADPMAALDEAVERAAAELREAKLRRAGLWRSL